MPYLHEFGENDVFVNRMVAYPQYQFTFYSGSSYINNDRDMGINIPSGSISLYEYNVDRDGTTQQLIYPFIIKAGQWLSFPNVTTTEYETLDYGGKITGSYPLTSSVTREYFPAWTTGYPFPDGTNVEKDLYVDTRKEIISLRNTLEYYRGLSNSHHFTGSFMTGAVNLLDIPSIFYDNSIKKGTVDLKFYYTGSLMARAQDTRQNGELVGTYGATSGSIVGLVLYNEGFVILTSSANLSTNLDNYLGTGTLVQPQWNYFGAYSQASISGSTGTFASASLYRLDLDGTQKIPVMTAFATAQRGHVNNSLNPTWLSASNGDWHPSSSVSPQGYVEPRQVTIKNTVESQYCEFDDEFEKQVFISEIGIFDEGKNLIAIAKLANPVLKKDTDDMTFKLKLDI